MLFGLTLVRVNDSFDLASSSFRSSFGAIGSCALTFQSSVNHFMLRICIVSGSKKKEHPMNVFAGHSIFQSCFTLQFLSHMCKFDTYDNSENILLVKLHSL